MTFFPIAPGSDDRRKRCAVPIVTRNMVLEDVGASSATRGRYMLTNAPGRTRFATLPANCRGLFCQPGVADDKLYAAAGGAIYRVGSDGNYGSIGAIAGGDIVHMAGLRTQLIARAFQSIHYYAGSTLSTVTDSDAPDEPSSLAVVAGRVVCADSAADTFNWSVAGDPSSWNSAGIAADINLPDPIRNQVEYRGDLLSLGTRSAQVWKPTIGAESEAFSPLEGVDIRRGLLAQDAICPIGEGDWMLIGDDRVFHRTSGYNLVPVPNRDAEIAMQALTDSQIAGAVAWSYKDGSKEFAVFNVGLQRAFQYDVTERVWSERALFGASAYDIDFAARAFGRVIVGSRSSPILWALDSSAFDDDGEPIEREMTLHIPAGGGASIDRLVFELQVRDQPLTGQGSSPTMMLTYSRDGGNRFSLDRDGVQRTLVLPGRGQTRRVQASQFGKAPGDTGFLLRLRMTDPVRIGLTGVWVNPDEREIT